MIFICSLKTFCLEGGISVTFPLLLLLGEDLGMTKPVLTRPQSHFTQDHTPQVHHNSKSPSPSLLSRHSPVCTLSHQNWADYLSLSLQKAWMLKTHYMVFCGRGRSLKCSWGGSTSPPKKFEKFSTTPRVSWSHHTHPVLRPQYLSFLFPSRMTSREPDLPVYYSFFFLLIIFY